MKTSMRLLLLAGLMVTAPAMSATTCIFNTVGTTWALMGDCTTDATIVVPDGMTLQGNDYSITARDPASGGFKGAIVAAFGGTAHVTGLTVTTLELASSCKVGADRLRGIMFDGTSGSITGNTILNVNKGPSGCQEGNAIEVRNCYGETTSVEVSHNNISSWQKTGIVANCDVDVTISHNKIGGSATQDNLAANGIQVGYGAKGTVTNNHVAGNSWTGASDYVATGVLVYCAGLGTVIRHNNVMDGNADVGIYVLDASICGSAGGGVTVDNNRVFETGDDRNSHFYDIGIEAYPCDSNPVTNNKVRGFATGYGCDFEGGKNKSIPSPKD